MPNFVLTARLAGMLSEDDAQHDEILSFLIVNSERLSTGWTP